MKTILTIAALVAATKFIAVPQINAQVNEAANAQKIQQEQLIRP